MIAHKEPQIGLVVYTKAEYELHQKQGASFQGRRCTRRQAEAWLGRLAMT